MLEEVVQKGTAPAPRSQGHRAAGRRVRRRRSIHRGGYGRQAAGELLGFAPRTRRAVAILVVNRRAGGQGIRGYGARRWRACVGRHREHGGACVAARDGPRQAKETAPVLVSALVPGLEGVAELADMPAGGRLSSLTVGLGSATALRRLVQSSLEPELRGRGRGWPNSRGGTIVKRRDPSEKWTLAPPAVAVVFRRSQDDAKVGGRAAAGSVRGGRRQSAAGGGAGGRARPGGGLARPARGPSSRRFRASRRRRAFAPQAWNAARRPSSPPSPGAQSPRSWMATDPRRASPRRRRGSTRRLRRSRSSASPAPRQDDHRRTDRADSAAAGSPPA